MTFTEADHPRSGTGRFADKANTAPEADLPDEHVDRSLFDTKGLTQIGCQEREDFLSAYSEMTVFSSLTDTSGQYGSPFVCTE